MFKYGDLVVGRDGSYVRSIYKFVKPVSNNRSIYVPVAYRGEAITPAEAQRFTGHRDNDEFRLAKSHEIKEAGYTKAVDVLHLLYKLGIGHESEY